jgi:TRAP-type C4-dicarboxylate transport system permease small subunit
VRILKLVDHTITTLVTWCLLLLFVGMVGIAALQVLLRIFFQSGILWGDVAARHMVLWVGFLGAYMATREDKHFHIDVLTRFLPVRFRSWLGALSDLFAVVICYLLLQASLTFIEVGMDPEAMLFPHVTERNAAMILPVGFGLIMLQFLLRMIANIFTAIGGSVPEELAA